MSGCNAYGRLATPDDQAATTEVLHEHLDLMAWNWHPVVLMAPGRVAEPAARVVRSGWHVEASAPPANEGDGPWSWSSTAAVPSDHLSRDWSQSAPARSLAPSVHCFSEERGVPRYSVPTLGAAQVEPAGVDEPDPNRN